MISLMTGVAVDGFSPSTLAEYLLRSIPSMKLLVLSRDRVNEEEPLIETSATVVPNVSEGGGCMEQTISIVSPTQGAMSGENVMMSRGNISIVRHFYFTH